MRVDFGTRSRDDHTNAEPRLSYTPISYFIRVRNVGDALNPLLVHKLFGIDARWSDRKQPHVTAIGSLISVSPLSHLWGSGLMHEQAKVEEASASHIFALRGKLSHSQFVRSGILPGRRSARRSRVPDFAARSCSDTQEVPHRASCALRRSRPPLGSFKPARTGHRRP